MGPAAAGAVAAPGPTAYHSGTPEAPAPTPVQ
jgi:hypothetical protein